MKIYLCLYLCLYFLVGCTKPVASSLISTPGPANDYKLVWQDEFEGNNLDITRWNTRANIRDDATQTANAVSVTNGLLNIITYTENGINYTGFIDTHGKYEPVFGYIEARLRFKNSPGQWSAFWLQSANNKAYDPVDSKKGVEVDMIEHRAVNNNGKDLSNSYVCNIHWNGYTPGLHKTMGSNVLSLPAGESFSDWHTVGLLWDATGYRFYIDNTMVWKTASGLSTSNEFIRLTSEVHNYYWAGVIPATGYGSKGSDANPIMQVDWIRVWQK